MNIDHHLQDKLRTLRLSGILETLEARLTQAQAGELGFVEFLQLIFQDEIERRAASALARRIQKAGFDDNHTIEGFNFNAVPKLKSSLIRDLATCSFVGHKESIILCGPTGVGKTHLAESLGHLACRQGYSVLFVKPGKMFRKLYAARADQSWEKVIRKYLSPDLLIWDDFGLQPFNQHQAEDLYEIISERTSKGSNIITSNRPIQDWLGLFPDPVMAQAAVDRLRQNAHLIVIEGDSYRGRLTPGQSNRDKLNTGKE
ncbi:MAG: ATP-binding protein [Deltaproteobacteria bacterium]|nr:ATP-binding protein [Deltaproteobacteria bacterium]